MSHSRENVSIDFFKPLYLRQKHIFCKPGDDKLLEMGCFIIWRLKTYFTTFCFFKSFDLVEILKNELFLRDPWFPQERSHHDIITRMSTYLITKKMFLSKLLSCIDVFRYQAIYIVHWECLSIYKEHPLMWPTYLSFWFSSLKKI